MNLAYAFLANAAEIAPDGRFHVLGGGIDGISVVQFPAFVPVLAIVANVFFSPEECGHTYTLRVAFTQPNGCELGTGASLELKPDVSPHTIRLGARIKVVVNMFSLPFAEEGKYVASFYVRDNVIGTIDFYVALVAESAAAGGQA